MRRWRMCVKTHMNKRCGRGSGPSFQSRIRRRSRISATLGNHSIGSARRSHRIPCLTLRPYSLRIPAKPRRTRKVRQTGQSSRLDLRFRRRRPSRLKTVPELPGSGYSRRRRWCGSPDSHRRFIPPPPVQDSGSFPPSSHCTTRRFVPDPAPDAVSVSDPDAPTSSDDTWKSYRFGSTNLV